MRLKALIATGIVCTVSFAAAAPVHAKSDNGHGKVQRCQAAKNGKHNGFTCETGGGETTAGQCPSGFNAMPMRFDPTADANANGIICRNGNVSTDDLSA
jgi:hypothetical protein